MSRSLKDHIGDYSIRPSPTANCNQLILHDEDPKHRVIAIEVEKEKSAFRQALHQLSLPDKLYSVKLTPTQVILSPAVVHTVGWKPRDGEYTARTFTSEASANEFINSLLDLGFRNSQFIMDTCTVVRNTSDVIPVEVYRQRNPEIVYDIE
jgi:hypothetical protein